MEGGWGYGGVVALFSLVGYEVADGWGESGVLETQIGRPVVGGGRRRVGRGGVLYGVASPNVFGVPQFRLETAPGALWWPGGRIVSPKRKRRHRAPLG